MKIRDLIQRVYDKEVVLPQFQRSFIWKAEDVKELLISVFGNYFIGSMLMMDSTKDNCPFDFRPIEGVEKVNPNTEVPTLVKVLLDGQQRTTALFYALYELDFPLKGSKSAYKFFLKLDSALEEKWDDAVISVSVRDRKTLNDIYSNKNIIPISLLKDIVELSKEYKDHEQFGKIIDIANNFLNYEIHVISLPRNTSLHKIVETFERINRTGVPLSIFDLLTARLHKHNINLRDILEESKLSYTFLKDVQPEFVLKTIALLRDKEPKPKNILELNPRNFELDWKRACEALESAYSRIKDHRDGYGVLDFKKWAPYSTLIVPLAALICNSRDKKIPQVQYKAKIDRWYWISVFSNRYDQGVDSTSYRDYKSIIEWIEKDIEPEFITKFNVNEVDLDIDKQTSAIYRGVINLIVLKGAYDFETGEPPQFTEGKLQDDHIFPKSKFKENRRVDTVLNRTLISSNQTKKDKRPSEYFGALIKNYSKQKVIEILESHLIPKEALESLLRDDINGFMEYRRQAILNEIKERTN